MAKKKRARVPKGGNFMTMAQSYGTTPDILSQINPGVTTASPGTYINIPDAPNIQGAPPPPQVSTITPAGTVWQNYTNTYTPTATAEQAGRESKLTPPFPTSGYGQLRNAYLNPTAPVNSPVLAPPPTPGWDGYYSANNSGDVAVMDAVISQMGQINNMSVTPQMAESIAMYQGIPTDQISEFMTNAGFTLDASGNWTRGTTTPEPRNAGGWVQGSDGQWRLNRNAAQERKRAERRAGRKTAGQGGAINWSLG